MALTDSSRIFTTNVTDIKSILDYCEKYFSGRGYSVSAEELADGGFVSITKGGIFKSISGMQTGLNITLTKMPNAISVAMKVGIFGKQLVPSVISMLIFWPVLIPQIYGLIQQNKLDTEAYNVIETAIKNCENTVLIEETADIFCMYCGVSNPSTAVFCVKCGKRVTDELSLCSSCGAELSGKFVFCPKCGERVPTEN